jgi:hypothetical protein
MEIVTADLRLLQLNPSAELRYSAKAVNPIATCKNGRSDQTGSLGHVARQ